MTLLLRSIFIAALVAPISLPAQVLPPPENVVQLSAQAAVEVPQDVLAIVLAATREGSDPAQLQAQLKAVLDPALAEARRAAQPPNVEVRTGGFNVSRAENVGIRRSVPNRRSQGGEKT